MQVPLQIAYEGDLTSSPALQARIEQEARKLERFSSRITCCHVAVAGRSGRRRHGDLFKVRIRIASPGRADIVVDRNPDADHAHEDAFVAIRDAFNAARRRLQDLERKLGGQPKRHEGPPHGRIARLFRDQGYGFIQAADGQEVYFHRNAVVDGFEALSEGAQVRYASEEGDNGPQASTVHLVGRG